MKKKTGKMPPALAAYWKAKRSKKKTATKPKKTRKTKSVKKSSSLQFKLIARGSGKPMHFDGSKFSERSETKVFPTLDAARSFALKLLAKYPVLRKYRLSVELYHPK